MQLLDSERRWCIRFAPAEGCYKYKHRTVPRHRDPVLSEGEVALTGLREILRRTCFPNYRYEEARGDTSTGVPQFASQRRPTGLRAAHHGAARGRDVHEQLATYVNRSEEIWRALYAHNCNAYVPRIIAFLKSKKLRPVVAEFEDFILDLHIGTAIDLICIDETDHGIVPIELKIGGDNYFEKSNGPLVAPVALHGFSNSPRNQALLQLLFEREMLTRNYPYVRVSRAYVLLVRTEDIVLYGLTPAFIEAQPALVAALAARRRIDRESRAPATASRGRGVKRAHPEQVAAVRSLWAR